MLSLPSNFCKNIIYQHVFYIFESTSKKQEDKKIPKNKTKQKHTVKLETVKFIVTYKKKRKVLCRF
jgi:hypothetical protein